MVKTAAAVGIMWAVVMGVMPVIERLEAILTAAELIRSILPFC